MATRNRRSFGAGGGMRQRVSWNRTVAAAVTTVAPQTNVLVASIPTTAFAEESTIRRTILSLRVISDQSAASEQAIGAVGMFVANSNAITAGAASLLSPVTDANDEAWYLWHPINQQFIFVTGAGFESDSGVNYQVDSKAQRKVQTGQSAVLMVHNNHATHTFLVSAVFSTLVGFGLKRS